MSWPTSDNEEGGKAFAYGTAAFFAAYIFIAAHLTFFIWACAAFILLTTAIVERRFRSYPSMADALEILSAVPAKVWTEEELSRVHGLREMQKEYFNKKSAVYRSGDHEGVPRRRDGRFDERGRGKELNAEIARLERIFEHIANELCDLDLKVVGQKQELAGKYYEWRRRRLLAITIRAVAAAYVGSVLTLAISRPEWLHHLSLVNSDGSLLPAAGIQSYYGPSVIGGATALIAALGARAIHSIQVLSFSPDRAIGVRNAKIAEFATSVSVSESATSDEEHPELQNDEPEDTISPYQVLGLTPTASREEIVVAWRKLVMLYHPDHQQNFGSELRKLAEQKTKQFNWAKDEALKACDGKTNARPNSNSTPHQGFEIPEIWISSAADRDRLKSILAEARQNQRSLGHVLLIGINSNGKLVAEAIAQYQNRNCRATSAEAIREIRDLAVLLTNLEDQDVLFIESIDRLDEAILDTLAAAMLNFRFNLNIGDGPARRDVRIDLSPFTLVASCQNKNTQVASKCRFAATAELAIS